MSCGHMVTVFSLISDSTDTPVKVTSTGLSYCKGTILPFWLMSDLRHVGSPDFPEPFIQ